MNWFQAMGVGLSFAAIACRREDRTPPLVSAPVLEFHSVHPARFQPGAALPVRSMGSGYKETAYAISQGQQLYQQLNCSGCHASGGGGMGPPLMDGKWIYGNKPADIFATIVDGRPNGMPSFGGAIPRQQILQLVAYVRTLSGVAPKDAMPTRPDTVRGIPARNVTPAEGPRP
jgi:cytochrome c oxidase cbb3-type subunit 3